MTNPSTKCPPFKHLRLSSGWRDSWISIETTSKISTVQINCPRTSSLTTGKHGWFQHAISRHRLRSGDYRGRVKIAHLSDLPTTRVMRASSHSMRVSASARNLPKAIHSHRRLGMSHQGRIDGTRTKCFGTPQRNTTTTRNDTPNNVTTLRGSECGFTCRARRICRICRERRAGTESRASISQEHALTKYHADVDFPRFLRIEGDVCLCSAYWAGGEALPAFTKR